MRFAVRSIDDLILDANGRPSGFDYMRITLAVMVVASHAWVTSKGEGMIQWSSIPSGAVVSTILPMFFALSGFLVAGSMERCKTVGKFLGLRFIRIYPALAVEVLLTAFLIGPFVTALTPAEYFTDSGFFRYLLNVTGHITIYLPESFLINPLPLIANLQLWTVPYELYCYFAMAFLIVLGIKKDRKRALVGTLVIFVLMTLYTAMHYDWDMPSRHGPITGKMLVASFLLGVCAYLYRKEIPVSGFWIAVAVVLTFVLFAIEPVDWFLPIFPIAYLTVALGVQNPRRSFVINGGDYSYGIYLYHFVVAQTVIYASGGSLGWVWTLLITLPLSALVAAISWHYVEKPALELRHTLNRIETNWLARRKAGEPLFRRSKL